MDWITAPRGGGKTYAAVTFTLAHPRAILLVPTYQRKRAILDQYDPLRLLDLESRIITLDGAHPGMRLSGFGRQTPLIIDNTEEVLEHLLGHPVTLATANSVSNNPHLPIPLFKSRFEDSWAEPLNKKDIPQAADLRRTFGLQPR